MTDLLGTRTTKEDDNVETPERNSLNRRQFLYGLGSSIGAIAFSSLLAAENSSAKFQSIPPMLSAKAKSCIFLTMEGGPSHIDTFDPKPKLVELHLQNFERSGQQFAPMFQGNRFFVQSPFTSRRVGNSGADLSSPFVHLAEVADDICWYRGCQAESVDHPTAMYHLNTGNKFGGDPAMGSWVAYGLGALNQNLPAFVVLPEAVYPQGSAGNWSNGFLPARLQGTPLRSVGSPILDLHPPKDINRAHQRHSLDLLNHFNRKHQQKHPRHDELTARMENYELAFRMQMEVPGIIDLDQEPKPIKELYGIGESHSDNFGRKCLLARRLVEKGVRFVQVYSQGWDSHDFLEKGHGALMRRIDKPIAGLIKDLKQRGLLDETLIVWSGEFGRSPDNELEAGGELSKSNIRYGRDHNSQAMAVWLAGGGVKAGHIIGQTDEIGAKAIEVVHPLKDLHVTILRLLGLDDNKLTYFHGGRFKQLSQTGGTAIDQLIG